MEGFAPPITSVLLTVTPPYRELGTAVADECPLGERVPCQL